MTGEARNSLVVAIIEQSRLFWTLPPASKAKVAALCAVVAAAIFYVPPIRGIAGFLLFMMATLSFFLWLGEGRRSRTRTIAQLLFALAVMADVAIYGRESLTVRVVAGMFQGLLGNRPGCTGPVQNPLCG